MAVALTTLPPLLSEALERPRGARFHRVALQVNPFDYVERHSKATVYVTEAEYNDAVVAACLEHDIEAIAITDHFRVSSFVRNVLQSGTKISLDDLRRSETQIELNVASDGGRAQWQNRLRACARACRGVAGGRPRGI
jgi:hypothetical protein